MTCCPYGEPAQAPAAQYPCPAACGCWSAHPWAPCLPCWLAGRTYTRAQVAMLPADDPRRHRIAASPPR